MKIAVIGGGRVGGALARAWSAQCHDIVLGVRDPEADSVRQLRLTATAMAPGDAAKVCELIVLAVPWGAAESLAASLGDLAGKIVIDCMNPIAMGPGGMTLERGHTTSGGETLQSWLPGTTRRQPLSASQSSTASQAAMQVPGWTRR